MGAEVHDSEGKTRSTPGRRRTARGFAKGTTNLSGTESDGADLDIAWRAPAIANLHPLVRERLTALGIRDLDHGPDLCSWQSFARGMSECVRELERNLHRLSGMAAEAREPSDLIAAERKQRALLEAELRGAADVQRRFMPDKASATWGGVELTSLFRPAHICGGDWWSWFELPDETLMVLVADVTGHGFAPAMMTGVAKGAADMIVRMTPADELTPARMLRELNVSICDAGPDSLMMTCAATHIDPRAGEVRFASAGHPLPYVMRAGKRGVELSQLIASGAPLGAARDSDYEGRARAIERNDTLLWYTDGLTEASDECDEHFGDKRLRAVLTEEKRPRRPDALRDALWSALSGHLGAKQPDDDITLVVARIDRDRDPNPTPTVTFR